VSLSSVPPKTENIEQKYEYEREIANKRTKLTMRMFDTPGYGDVAETRKSIDSVLQFCEERQAEALKMETDNLHRPPNPHKWNDPKIHAVIYFLQPHRLHEVDLMFMEGLNKVGEYLVLIKKFNLSE
jgi:septin family protein